MLEFIADLKGSNNGNILVAEKSLNKNMYLHVKEIHRCDSIDVISKAYPEIRVIGTYDRDELEICEKKATEILKEYKKNSFAEELEIKPFKLKIIS